MFVNMLIYVSSSVSLHYYFIWVYQIDMINMLFGEVNVIRWRYVLWLNNSHPTLSDLLLNISTGYLATYLHVYFNDKCKRNDLIFFFL